MSSAAFSHGWVHTTLQDGGVSSWVIQTKSWSCFSAKARSRGGAKTIPFLEWLTTQLDNILSLLQIEVRRWCVMTRKFESGCNLTHYSSSHARAHHCSCPWLSLLQRFLTPFTKLYLVTSRPRTAITCAMFPPLLHSDPFLKIHFFLKAFGITL